VNPNFLGKVRTWRWVGEPVSQKIRRSPMDGMTRSLKQNLENLLRQAAEAAVELDRANGTIVGIPHYSVIEARAHDLGQQLSRQIQGRHMSQIAGGSADAAKCPGCGVRCETRPNIRHVTSIDGPLNLDETVARCPACRRDFFPPPGNLGL
jgi:hypothetical protein